MLNRTSKCFYFINQIFVVVKVQRCNLVFDERICKLTVWNFSIIELILGQKIKFLTSIPSKCFKEFYNNFKTTYMPSLAMS